MKYTLRLLAILVASTASLVACSTPPEQQNVTIERDPYSNLVEVDGVSMMENPFGGTSKIWRIRSFVDHAHHTVVHQAYVTIGYMGEWRFYDHAADQNKVHLRTVSIDRQVISCSSICSYEEILGVNLPDPALRKNAGTGYSFKIYGKTADDVVIDLSPVMLQKQLKAVSDVVRQGR